MVQGQRPPKNCSYFECQSSKNQERSKTFPKRVNYYIAFIPNLSTITKPFRELTQENVKFTWNESCQQVFEICNQILVSDRVLILYRTIYIFPLW